MEVVVVVVIVVVVVVVVVVVRRPNRSWVSRGGIENNPLTLEYPKGRVFPSPTPPQGVGDLSTNVGANVSNPRFELQN